MSSKTGPQINLDLDSITKNNTGELEIIFDPLNRGMVEPFSSTNRGKNQKLISKFNATN
jgi:hypothetical protein